MPKKEPGESEEDYKARKKREKRHKELQPNREESHKAYDARYKAWKKQQQANHVEGRQRSFQSGGNPDSARDESKQLAQPVHPLPAATPTTDESKEKPKKKQKTGMCNGTTRPSCII